MASKTKKSINDKPMDYIKPKSRFQMYQEEEMPIINEVMSHFKQWEEDNDTRRTRKGGWNDVTDAYWGKLPLDWPFINRVVDPRIRTSINEKDDRILNAKLKGRLVPREGGDVLKARLNNAVLEHQWDNANDGGSMLVKWKQCSQDTRLYASKFAFVPWRYECDKDGKVIFNGNEFKPLDIRDCGMDPTADHIRNAKWFQKREWAKEQDLERILDTIPEPGEKNKLKIKINKLKELKSNSSDSRSVRYQDRVLELKSLEDRVGSDKSFPVYEIVTEYRSDRWITFSPRHQVILRDIPNPYRHRKIPIVQLRYYSIQGDPLGESEVEPVLGLWRAIQATLNGFLDSYMIHIRPPLKIIDGQVRIETIVFGPEAQMIMNRPDAVTEFQSSGEAIRYFQSAYQAELSAFNTAMGDISQGVSAVDPESRKKTATEIKQSSQQQNVRDQANQNALAEALQDMMSMWLINNQQFLFEEEKSQEYLMRIVGRDQFEYFKRAGLDEEEFSDEAAQAVADILMTEGGNMSDDDIAALAQSGKMPKFPVIENPEEKDPDKYKIKPKMKVSDMNDAAEVSIVPEDLEGTYDYIPDVESMAAGAQQDMINGRQKAIELLQNPQILQLLQQEGKKPKISEILESMLDDVGLKDAERFFEDIDPQTMQGAQPEQPQQPGMPMDPSMMQQPMTQTGEYDNIIQEGQSFVDDAAMQDQMLNG